MEFPKQVMTVSELKKLGFKESYLAELTRKKDQDFCWKMNSTKTNSPFLFDTTRLQKYLDKQQRILAQASHMI